MFGFSLFIVLPVMLILGGLLGWGINYIIGLNNDLAKQKENEILAREIMARQAEDEAKVQKRALEERVGAAYDEELERLIKAQRYDDALGYIDERRRLAFEQGNTAREDMYRRYRENIEFETRDRSQEGF